MSAPGYGRKLHPGDRVAIVSPSAGLPGMLPLPYEMGLRRLSETFGLVPVEYPTTRRMGSTPRDRAADLHAAFRDPGIAAVLASIGGEDQITVLPHLDADLIQAHPKPFLGYSDNTALLAYLWRLGIVGYHGGLIMMHFGRPGALHPLTEESLRAALFQDGDYLLTEPASFTEHDRPWSDPATFLQEPRTQPAPKWSWHNADRIVEGVSWGGNLEILSWLLLADPGIGVDEHHDGGVLFIETSEEIPSDKMVYRMLRSIGLRGLLRRFDAVLVGRAKAWALDQETTAEQRLVYRENQRRAVWRALEEYADSPVVVFDVDIGHTDPQLVLPYGGRIRVDGPARQITVRY